MLQLCIRIDVSGRQEVLTLNIFPEIVLQPYRWSEDVGWKGSVEGKGLGGMTGRERPYGCDSIPFCRCTYVEGLLHGHCFLVFRCIPNSLNSTSEYLLAPCGTREYSLDNWITPFPP